MVFSNPTLLKILLVLLTAFGYLLAAMLVGGTAVALCVDFHGRRNRIDANRAFASELLERAVPAGGAGLLLILVLALGLLCQWILYAPPPRYALYPGGAVALLSAGFALIYAYRALRATPHRSHLDLGAGALGVLTASAALFLLICGESLLLRPEWLPLSILFPSAYLSWHGVVRFLSFAAIALASAGYLAGLGRRKPPEELRGARLRTVLVAAGVALWAPLALFETAATPALALSLAGIALVAGGLLVAAAAALLLMRGEATTSRAGAVLALLLLPVWVLTAQAGREQVQVPIVVAGVVWPLEAPPPGAPAETVPAVPHPAQVDGESVFKRYCAACHQFDRRVVGPPLNEVLPKYEGAPQSLKDFIRDPVKVDPDYPPMPKLGLSEEEIEAVAAWVLERAGG